MNKTKEKVKDILMENFNDIYHCTRVWSAWGYNTMTHDDFVLFEEEDEALDEIVEKIITNKAQNIDDLQAIFENYEMYHNDDIDNNFDSNFFDSQYLDYVDLETISQQLKPVLKEKKSLKKNI